MLDPTIGKWFSIDPLAEETFNYTPYHYVYNNPIAYVDPDGMFGDYYTKSGEYIGNDGIDDDKVYEVSIAQSVSSELEGAPEGSNILIEYVGQVESVKMTFTGEANSEDTSQADGQLNVIQEVSNGKEYTKASYSAVGGPWGNGSPENGDYLANTLLDRSPSGWYNAGMNKDGVGFSLNLDPQFETGRSLLRIHPDGGSYFGTQGCVGLTCGQNGLSKFQSMMQQTLGKQNSIRLNINILNNPNNNGNGQTINSNGE